MAFHYLTSNSPIFHAIGVVSCYLPLISAFMHVNFSSLSLQGIDCTLLNVLCYMCFRFFNITLTQSLPCSPPFFCRKRPPDASASEFDAAMRNVFQILMNVSREFLYRSTSSPEVIEESEYEFAEYICESMVSLGSSNLQCIAGDNSALALYLQLVIAVADR